MPTFWAFAWRCGPGVWQALPLYGAFREDLPNTWWHREGCQRVSPTSRFSIRAAGCTSMCEDQSGKRLVSWFWNDSYKRCFCLLLFFCWCRFGKCRINSFHGWVACWFFLRKSFLMAAVPVHLAGIGGPGAPHVFRLVRRCNLGCSISIFVYWNWPSVFQR